MNSMMDIITSLIIAGMLILIIIQVDSNVKASSIFLQQDIRTQDNMSVLNDIVSYDFRKIGHCLSDPDNAISLADTSRIRFSYNTNPRAVLGVHTSDSVQVEYYLFGDDTASPNPNDKKLLRKVNNSNHDGYCLGLTRFRLRYYNRQGTELSTPVVADSLSRIRSIRVAYRIESREPFKGEYSKFMFVTRITPKNLLGE